MDISAEISKQEDTAIEKLKDTVEANRAVAVERMLAGESPTDVSKAYGLKGRQAQAWLNHAKAERYDKLLDDYRALAQRADGLSDRVRELEKEAAAQIAELGAHTREDAQLREENDHLRKRIEEFAVERKALLSTLSVQYNQIRQINQQLLERK